MSTFADLGLNKNILKALSELGFETPTPIQEEAIPRLIETDQDIIAYAQTGTGKTAAFGLPAVQLTEIDNKQTQTIILSPTRELCIQITRDLEKYAKYTKGLNILAVYGGSDIQKQIRTLRKGVHIVVATPGRAKDLINRKELKLRAIARVVLDEADEMLTMGFKDDLDVILSKTPDEKQTLLFSATMPNEMLRITKKYMHDAYEIKVAKKNITAKNVTHVQYTAAARDRYEVLKRIADANLNIYGIVFCRTRRETTSVANKLNQDGYNADALNGDLSQNQRDEVMGRFRKKQLDILVATDVAARGIDVDSLTHVINYNLPDDPEIYTHRSGRTGRAGNTGVSVIITHSRERRKVQAIEKFSGIKFNQDLIPTGDEICKIQLYSLVEKVGKVKVNEKQIAPFLPKIYKTFEDFSKEDLIKHFVSAEFNRFLTYYKNSKDLNQTGKQQESKTRNRGGVNFSRLFINLGKKDKLTPARLLGLINESLDSNDMEIGKIDILDNFSFFEIGEDSVAQLSENISEMEFNNRRVSVEISNEKQKGGRRSRGGRKRNNRGDDRSFSNERRGGDRRNKRKDNDRRDTRKSRGSNDDSKRKEEYEDVKKPKKNKSNRTENRKKRKERKKRSKRKG